MRRYLLHLSVVQVLLAACAAFAQELIPVEPGEQEVGRERKDWFFQQRAHPLGFIPAGAHWNALRELDRMERERRRLGAAPGGIIAPGEWTSIGPQRGVPGSHPGRCMEDYGRGPDLDATERRPAVALRGFHCA